MIRLREDLGELAHTKTWNDLIHRNLTGQHFWRRVPILPGYCLSCQRLSFGIISLINSVASDSVMSEC